MCRWAIGWWRAIGAIVRRPVVLWAAMVRWRRRAHAVHKPGNNGIKLFLLFGIADGPHLPEMHKG